ncbi:hypothetical protein NDU88_003009 [Pleurodeles waltl]|uniref:Uncharacterized protein n=1 Tax=Pleurodeles waltl TaxID=8319 RepID=A0AAV7TMD9_PLEWA|nr:hypothetical protein NDU88_003009 [Pleurodeles waltl]
MTDRQGCNEGHDVGAPGTTLRAPAQTRGVPDTKQRQESRNASVMLKQPQQAALQNHGVPQKKREAPRAALQSAVANKAALRAEL